MTAVEIPVESVLRFSASRVGQWMKCPLQAYYHYELNLERGQNAAASFGSALHAGLYHYNTTGSLDEAMAVFLDWWDHPEKHGIEPTYWPRDTSYMEYRKLGISVMNEFDASMKWDTRTVLGAEIKFCVPFGEFELTGSVDLLEVRKSGTGRKLLRTLDWKSGSKQPTKAELALDVQFTCYDYAASCPEFWLGNGTPEFPGLPDGAELMGQYFDLPRRSIWYHLRGQKEIDAGARTAADHMRLYRVCHEIAKAIRADVHVPKIGDSCRQCDYTEHCYLDIPVDLDEAPDDPDRWV